MIPLRGRYVLPYYYPRRLQWATNTVFAGVTYLRLEVGRGAAGHPKSDLIEYSYEL